MLRRLAVTLAGLSVAMLGALAGLHLLHVGAPLPAVLREGEATARAGQLQLFADPWAEVYIDGQWVETTPFARPLNLRPGRRFIELRNPHYQPLRQVVDILPGQLQALHLTMPELAPRLEAVRAAGGSAEPSASPRGSSLTQEAAR